MAILDFLTAPYPKLRLKAKRVEDIAAMQGLKNSFGHITSKMGAAKWGVRKSVQI